MCNPPTLFPAHNQSSCGRLVIITELTEACYLHQYRVTSHRNTQPAQTMCLLLAGAHYYIRSTLRSISRDKI